MIEALARIVGERHVLVDADVAAPYATDWTGRFVGHAAAVVRPGTVEEVAAVVRFCASAGIAVVPQGGNTGLVAGGVPLDGEVVLSLRRFDGLGAVDVAAQQITAGAGVTLEQVQEAARAEGLDYGIDLAARGSATVGGTIATNAGGTQVLRWGTTRAQLLGVEAVLGDGSIVHHLGGLVKDNTGYDLAGLLCGSEGTLGVVTAARLRLVPRFEHVVTALVAFASVDDAVAAVGPWRRRIEGLDAAELFVQAGLELVEQVAGLAPPFGRPWPAYVLIEASGHTDPTDAVAAAVGEEPTVRDVAVARDGAGRRALWAYREEHTLAINTLGPPHKLDVTLPAGALGPFLHEVPEVVARVAPQARTWLFGHVADGNIHVNVTGVTAPGVDALDDPSTDMRASAPETGAHARMSGVGAPGERSSGERSPDESLPDEDGVHDRIDEAVLELVVHHGGSISAEHGIGRAKRRFLGLVRSTEEIEAFRRIKGALDPHGILNPHVLLPPAD